MKKNIIRSSANNNRLISFILACLVFVGLCLEGTIPAYNPISWMIFLIIVMLFNRVKLYDKRFIKISIIISLLFSFSLVFGKIVNQLLSNSKLSVWSEFVKIKNITIFAFLGILIYIILLNLFSKLCDYEIKIQLTNSKKVFICSFIIIFTCWIPYFLALYPGELSIDSINEINTIANNFVGMSNHHPVIHILFIAIPYKIGMFVFNNANMAIAFCSLVQMSTMALIFSYFISFLSRKKINKRILIICICVFALLPAHAYYSVTMWKDVVFSGLVLILSIKIIDICDNNKILRFRNLIPFTIISILVLFFRNNAVYMYFVLILFMLITLRKHLKKLLLCFSIVLFTYFFTIGPVFKLLNIRSTESSEYIGMPLQQIARMAYKDVKFNEKETKLINELMGVENMKKYYFPEVSDNIKFNKNYKTHVFDNNKLEYFNLWLNLVIKHFDIATESYAVSTLGYWYPGVNNWTVHKNVSKNNLKIKRDPKGFEIVKKYVDNIECRDVPIISMSWSTSLAFWIILVFAVICVKRRTKLYLLPYIPVFGIWITMMLASPVYAEFRYIYCEYTCLPLLMILPYISKK